MPAPDPSVDLDDADIARRFLDAGVTVPAERAKGAYDAARRLLEASHWLRAPRDPAAEPAHVFDLTPHAFDLTPHVFTPPMEEKA